MAKVTKEIESFIIVNSVLGYGRVRILRMLKERGIEISHGSVHRVKAMKTQHLKDLLDFLSKAQNDSDELIKELSLATVMMIHSTLYKEGDEVKFELVFIRYMSAFLSAMWYYELYKNVGHLELFTTAFEKLKRLAELIDIYVGYYNIKYGYSFVFNWEERFRDLCEIPSKVINSLAFIDFNREMLDPERVRSRTLMHISACRRLAGRYLTQKRRGGMERIG